MAVDAIRMIPGVVATSCVSTANSRYEALGLKRPADLYTPACGLIAACAPLTSSHSRDIVATVCGRICLRGKKLNISIGRSRDR